MQRKGQAIEYALSLINLLQHDIQVLWQLIEEICDAEQGDLDEFVAKLDGQKKKQEKQERRQLWEEARTRARKWAERTYPDHYKNKNKCKSEECK